MAFASLSFPGVVCFRFSYSRLELLRVVSMVGSDDTFDSAAQIRLQVRGRQSIVQEAGSKGANVDVDVE